MKKALFLSMLLVSLLTDAEAQKKLNDNMQAVFDACWSMRTAISTGNTVSLRSANEAFRKCTTKYFSSLRNIESDIISVNNHFVWNEVFVDSLIAGRDVRGFAQRYAELRNHRGNPSSRGEILIKTCGVKGKGKALFSFTSEKHQEIAVIAEPKGKITLRVHCKKTGKWFKDDEDVNIGRDYRFQIFDIPDGVKDSVELEVINCGPEDISFVVICN